MGSSILFRAQSISIGHLLHFASFSAEKPPSPGSLPWLSPFLHSSCVSQPPVLIVLHDSQASHNGKGQQVGDRAFRCGYKGCGRLYTTAHHLKVRLPQTAFSLSIFPTSL